MLDKKTDENVVETRTPTRIALGPEAEEGGDDRRNDVQPTNKHTQLRNPPCYQYANPGLIAALAAPPHPFRVGEYLVAGKRLENPRAAENGSEARRDGGDDDAHNNNVLVDAGLLEDGLIVDQLRPLERAAKGHNKDHVDDKRQSYCHQGAPPNVTTRVFQVARKVRLGGGGMRPRYPNYYVEVVVFGGVFAYRRDLCCVREEIFLEK